MRNGLELGADLLIVLQVDADGLSDELGREKLNATNQLAIDGLALHLKEANADGLALAVVDVAAQCAKLVELLYEMFA